ncbi:choline/ethanolamine kinase family protein [Mangrovimicrobium sediminis]|uniref:choline/ethanolamine kinase family protein n=1 Tax=Mangrovimicrobium sediminis TaxID=2562682 RepID=UPI001436AA12|nr:choline/ethanolamine kinase family protein [Haliea sp. SAOS-164]
MPGPAQLHLALAQWRHWQCEPALTRAPELVHALSGGLSNRSYLVREGQHRFVVRLDGVDPARHCLDRHAEWQTLQCAAAAGIAPTPRYFNPQLGVLVCDYLAADPDQRVTLEDLAQLLRQVHALPAHAHRLNLREQVDHYERLIRRFDLHPNTYRSLQLSMWRHFVETSEPVLCHNDLLPANLLRSSGRLYALDWEYAAMGDRWFDLAGCVLGQKIAPGEEADFLTVYLGRAASEEERLHLQRHRCLCRYIEYLWHATENPPEKLPFLRERHEPPLIAELTSLGRLISRGSY